MKSMTPCLPLIAYRERAGLTPAALARKLEISRSFLFRLENGQRKAGTKLLRKIEAETGITPREMRPDLAAEAAMFAEAAE